MQQTGAEELSNIPEQVSYAGYEKKRRTIKGFCVCDRHLPEKSQKLVRLSDMWTASRRLGQQGTLVLSY